MNCEVHKRGQNLWIHQMSTQRLSFMFITNITVWCTERIILKISFPHGTGKFVCILQFKTKFLKYPNICKVQLKYKDNSDHINKFI